MSLNDGKKQVQKLTPVRIANAGTITGSPLPPVVQRETLNGFEAGQITPLENPLSDIIMVPQPEPVDPTLRSFDGVELVDELTRNQADPVEDVDGQLIPDSSKDTRVRLRCMRGREEEVYGPRDSMNILNILHDTDGILFPFTPSISVTHATEYQTSGLVHTNQDSQSYSRTPSVTLSVTGKFSIQNQREGRYVLAVLHLLRTISKMYFGEKDRETGKAGLPPPVMVFTGYGNYVFNNVPVIVRSHSYTLDETQGMVRVETAGGVAMLPSLMTISLEIVVQQTPIRQRKEFSLDEFRTGELMRRTGTGWL